MEKIRLKKLIIVVSCLLLVACIASISVFTVVQRIQPERSDPIRLSASEENPGRRRDSTADMEFQTMKLATFNIRMFSHGSRDAEELRSICSILKEYDFIAVQETKDTQVLDRTVSLLQEEYGLPFAYAASKPAGNAQKELYVFFYRNDRIVCLDEGTTYPDPDNAFIREPFFAKFRAGAFDFYAVNVHLIWGDTSRERVREAELLKNVYVYVQNLDSEDDVLLFGDFNQRSESPGFDCLRELDGMMCVNSSVPTTIKDNLYDNIWFQSGFTREYTGTFGVFAFDESLFSGDDDAARKAVSDHRPLWAVFFCVFDDDEG